MKDFNITIQTACLQWARERAGLSTSELAEKLKVQEDKIVAWEQSGELTLSQAEKLANVTDTPFGYLFLSQPPHDYPESEVISYNEEILRIALDMSYL